MMMKSRKDEYNYNLAKSCFLRFSEENKISPAPISVMNSTQNKTVSRF